MTTQKDSAAEQRCVKCGGSGSVRNAERRWRTCDDCGGSGSFSEAAASEGANTDEFRAMVSEADTEIARLKQAVGWILDAADAAYIEDENNERIHEIFNIAAKVCGITRRLPDENSPFEL